MTKNNSEYEWHLTNIQKSKGHHTKNTGNKNCMNSQIAKMTNIQTGLFWNQGKMINYTELLSKELKIIRE